MNAKFFCCPEYYVYWAIPAPQQTGFEFTFLVQQNQKTFIKKELVSAVQYVVIMFCWNKFRITCQASRQAQLTQELRYHYLTGRKTEAGLTTSWAQLEITWHYHI